MWFRKRRVIFIKSAAPKVEQKEEKVILPPKTVYFINNGDEVTVCYSIEDILDKFPTMNRRGIEAVLEGKQKSHVGYRIRKEVF